jgi:hypothetical protein
VSGPYVLESGADLDRLRRYRAKHPDVLIGTGEFGTWQALITEGNGETFVVRHTLHDLLDRLAEILGDR